MAQQVFIRDIRNQFAVKANPISTGLPEISTITTSATGSTSKIIFSFPNGSFDPGQPQIVYTSINTPIYVSGDSLGLDPGFGGNIVWYWFNVNGAGGNPGFPVEYEVDISSTDDQPTVANALANVINGSGYFSAADDGAGNVYITAIVNTSTISGPVDNSTGGWFSSTVIQSGTDPSGTPNGITSGDYITWQGYKWNGTTWQAANFHCWFNVDGEGGDPGLTDEIEADISQYSSNSDIVFAVGGAISTSSVTNIYFQSSQGVVDGTLNINSTTCGVVAAPSSTGTGSIGSTIIQQGVNSDVQQSNPSFSNGSIILLNTPSTNYFLQFSVAGFGQTVTIPGRTRIPVSIGPNQTATNFATAIKNAINTFASANMTATSVSNVVTITNVQNGNVTNISKDQIGPGTTVAVIQNGSP